MNYKDIDKKIKEYEKFVEEKLKVDLKDIELLLNDKVSKYKDWEEVKEVVRTVKEYEEKNRDLAVRLNMGSGIMLTGEIEDFRSMYISIGLDCVLEMDPEEASKYADIRLRLLQKEIEHFRKLAVDVKVHIKMVLLAINELQASMVPSKSK